MTADSNIDKLLMQLNGSHRNRKAFATASSDLAEIIWSGAIAEEQLIEWLKTGADGLRSTVAWAVWDIGGPQRALQHLMVCGASDSDSSVRLNSLRALVDYFPQSAERTKRITVFLNDRDAGLRQNAQKALEASTDV